MITVEFCGAAKTVTGSNYLIKTDTATFVVDCGMFQGKDVEHYNLEELAYDASKVDFALLTHSHIDHSGMLPKLTKAGFIGPIYAISETIQISTELLLDSAKLQENAYQRGEFYGKYTQIRALVYNTKDAIATISMFKVVSYDQVFEPAPGIKVKYIVAGHILGAASIEVEILDSDGTTKKIVFSGDIGRLQSTLIPTFDTKHESSPDYVIMESLYGGEYHVDRNESSRQLIEQINVTHKRGGSVFIPCFAVQRAQELLNDLKFAKEEGTIEGDVPVWLDSPLAQRVTDIYARSLDSANQNLFDFPGLVYVKKYKQSVQLTRKAGQIILAGSGMADGGRIVDHLAVGLENPKNSVIFVGFQAEGTLGRLLTEGAKKVVIGTKTINVNATILQLEGFSAHGDTNDYTSWVKRFLNENLKKVFLIHAEIDRAEALKQHFEGLGITQNYIPSMKETVTL